MHCCQINLPNLSKEQEQEIIDCYFCNEQYAEHPMDNKFTNYRNLHTWPNKNLELTRILHGNMIEDYISSMSIQRIIGPTFPPHIDVNRSCSAIYTIKGLAKTVFYSNQLRPIQDVTMNLGQWYVFDNSTRHAVYNIIEDRISVCIDFTKYFDNFLVALNFFSKNTNT